MRYVASRVARFVLVLFIVTAGTSSLLNLVPGDPAVELAGEGASEETITAIRERYDLDRPIHVQYVNWVGGLLQGDLGTSHRTAVPVITSIAQRLPVTIELSVLATLVAVAVAIPLGMATAVRNGSAFDRSVSGATSALISMPSFLLALLLVYCFAIQLRWFPVTGWERWSDGIMSNLRYAVLPVMSIAASEVVVLQRVLRAELIDTLQRPYIGVAEAKGLSRRFVLWRHALKPSSFALLTLSSLSMARLIGGTVVIETVFSLPGLGRLIVTSIQSKDLIVVQGAVGLIAVVYLFVNLAIDLLYAVLDPRLRVRR